ncbi:unnamed protein product [Rhizophagus irregularis]|nr:unnamed protein product [Rhizophagus irregularis]CAB5389434.1 unnamed protein product [Rhizophagus irregularis]
MSVERGQTTSSSTSQDKVPGQSKLKTILRVVLMILLEFALPIVLYYVLRIFMQEIWAFLISGVPPFIIAIFGLVGRKRVEIIGVLVLICLIFSAIVSLFYDNPKIQLLQKFMSLNLLPFNIIAMISIIPIKIGTFKMRPLLFYICKDLTTGGSFGSLNSEVVDESWDRNWVSYQYFRRGFIFMTIIWGYGLLSEVLVRAMIIYNLTPVRMSPDKALAASNIIHYVWLAKFALLTLFLVRRMKKQKENLVSASDSDKPPE